MTLCWTLLLKEVVQVTFHDFFVLEFYDWPVHLVSQLRIFFLNQTLLFLDWIEAEFFGLTLELNSVAHCSRRHYVVSRPITRKWFFGPWHWSSRECDQFKFVAVILACWTQDRVPQVRTLTSNLSGTKLWHLIIRRVVRFVYACRWPAAINRWSFESLLPRTCLCHLLLGREYKRWSLWWFIFAELRSESTEHSSPDGFVLFHLLALFLLNCNVSLYIFLEEHLVVLNFI